MKKVISLLLCGVMFASFIACDGNNPAKKDDASKNVILNGHEAVDLGLSSGTLWATCNVGAKTPKVAGDYFAWGETSTKSNYSSNNYTYNSNPAILPLACDVAHTNMGGSWRMPTITEFEELITECEWVWYGGGYEIIGYNGNSIFLPAASYYENDELNNVGLQGNYWTSSLNDNQQNYAYRFHFDAESRSISDRARYCGRTIRAVCSSRESGSKKVTLTLNVNDESMGSVIGGGEYECYSEITISATPNEGHFFTGWSDGSSENPRIVYLYDRDSTITANFIMDKSQEVNGHYAVDLGLPSGILWATCNIGASNPEDYGGYFAWGETWTKSNYYWDTYMYYNSSSAELTKYCTKSYYGDVDNKTTLDNYDDVATVRWGEKWRMPTIAEQQELLNECVWSWTTVDGINGYLVTSQKYINNSIFLPATGYRAGTALYDVGYYARYWSSSLYDYDPQNAYFLYFLEGNIGDMYNKRWGGFSIRPVCSPK